MRQARIALLKTTHVGFLAAIWAYESASRHFASRPARLGGLARSGTSRSAVRPQLVPPKGPALRGETIDRRPHRRGRSSVDGTVRSGGGGAHDVSHVQDLRDAIQQLSVQVEQLTTRMAQQTE